MSVQEAHAAPTLDFNGLCQLVKLGKDTVRKHLKSTDPQEYWPHARTSPGPKGRYRFYPEHVAAILAKLENPGPAQPEAAQITSADIARGIARRQRDRRLLAEM